MHLLDVAPTVLDLLGIEAPATMRGRSLLASATPVGG
jgi:bisphosphoglycerate-independent phosphoglycerate mutase (AlkP superfamily)